VSYIRIYEDLHGVTSRITAGVGKVESCVLGEPNTVESVCGPLTPKWQEDIRKKEIPSLSFYPTGRLKSVALEGQTTIITPIGELPAEFVTFYPAGEIRRVFPCNGKLSAYWTEEDEAALCPAIHFALNCGAFNAKVTAIHFFRSGALRSVSFWPNETVILRAFQGFMPTRIGFSLYENGEIESMEPPYPISIATPIGNISAYDPYAVGVHGESNSLSFNKGGTMRSITTVNSKIEIITPDRQSVFFGPTLRPDPILDDHVIIVPVQILFSPDSVTLENGIGKQTFSLIDCCFRIFTSESTPIIEANDSNCGDCSTCNLCG